MNSGSLHLNVAMSFVAQHVLGPGLRAGNGLQMSLTYLEETSNDLSFSLFSVVDSCVKTIGVHDRVFDVNDKVDNTLEPRG